MAAREKFAKLFAAETQWFQRKTEEEKDEFQAFQEAGLILSNLRLSGEILLLALGLKPAVLLTPFSTTQAQSFLREVVDATDFLPKGTTRSFVFTRPASSPHADLTGSVLLLRLNAADAWQPLIRSAETTGNVTEAQLARALDYPHALPEIDPSSPDARMTEPWVEIAYWIEDPPEWKGIITSFAATTRRLETIRSEHFERYRATTAPVFRLALHSMRL